LKFLTSGFRFHTLNSLIFGRLSRRKDVGVEARRRRRRKTRTSERGNSGRIPQESRGVECRAYTGVCRVPDPRPSPYKLHRGPLDGGPLHRKIRPPGASRRRATDIHVTLLPYRYQSRRHNTARRTYHHRYTRTRRNRSATVRRGERDRGRGKEREKERTGEEKKSSSILVTNRFDTFLPPFVSNVAYTRWTAVRETRKQLPLTMGSRDERVERAYHLFAAVFNLWRRLERLSA
jgi:hypothetical protein